MKLNTDLVLASRSPRRSALLNQMGLSFTVHPSAIEEVIEPDLTPAEVVQSLAYQKATAVAALFPSALTLGADTIVVLDGDILGQPSDASNASEMLHRLQGRSNFVYTGLALIHPLSNRSATAVECTKVSFGPMSEEEILAYVATGSPLDKAGSYGIQDDYGAQFISRIEGDYYTVVGLPIHRLYHLIRAEFMDLVVANV